MYIVLVQRQGDGDDLTQVDRECFLCQTKEKAIETQTHIIQAIEKKWSGFDCEVCRDTMSSKRYKHKSVFISIEDTNGYAVEYEVHIIEMENTEDLSSLI